MLKVSDISSQNIFIHRKTELPLLSDAMDDSGQATHHITSHNSVRLWRALASISTCIVCRG